ncbi:aminopeptidase N-like [Temnothorax longispinosus]|uniref:aminopeptidase N-like n=1 Tax=Temnothorax longispinosus TaxID=300112 RepID=UPI003A98EC17
MMNLFIVQSQYDSLHLDSHFDMNPPQINNLSQIDLIFSFPRYIKEIVVLRMLQNTVTDEMFRRGVRTWLHKYKYRSLTFNEFWSIQEEIASHSYEYYISYDSLNWIIYEHYPVISLTQEEPDIDIVQLSQYFNASQHSYGKWWIPISLVTKFSLKEPKNVWITPEKPSLSVTHTAEDDWIMVDIGQAGYYRVKYDMKNLRKISLYLNEEYKSISVINRAKIIDDAFHFLLTRQINATEFWALVKYLTQETDYVAWHPMLKMFEYISSVLPLSKGEIYFIHIKETMGEILTKPLKILGFEERLLENDFTKCLRQEIVKWACTVELTECQMNNFKLEQLLKEPALFKILPEWKHFIYCEGLKLIPRSDMGNNEFKEYNSRCLKDAMLQKFENFWPKSSKLRRCIYIFHSLITSHTKNEVILQKILSFFYQIKPREISTTAALINIINNIYSTAMLNKVNYSLKKEKLIDLGPIASKVYSKIETRMSEIDRHIGHLDMLYYTFESKEPGGKRSSNEDLLTDTCANYFVMSNVPVVSEQSLHARQKPTVPKIIDVKDGAGDSATAGSSCEDNTCDNDFTTLTSSRSNNEDLLTDTCAVMSNVSIVSEESLHAHQKPAVPKIIDVKDGAGDSATASSSCEDDTCDSDFTTLTLSRDLTLRKVSNEVQQSCVSSLQNLPTELPSSTSPRNYKDLKEKCPRFSLAAYGDGEKSEFDGVSGDVSGLEFEEAHLRKDQKTPRSKFPFWIPKKQSRRIQ